MFLRSISNFRGLAIIIIVAGHLYGSGFSGGDVFSSVIRNIVSGGTALFVFISGFMFHYVFFKRYEYKKFMVNKIKNVGVPYFLLSSLAIAFLFILSKEFFSPISETTSDMYISGIIFKPDDSTIETILKYYITGNALTAYWYIPFALLLFATSPIHVKFINFKLKTQVLMIIVLSLLAIIIHRPVNSINPLHSLVYYTPVYLIGILFSMYSFEVKNHLSNKITPLITFVVLFSFLEYLSGHQGNYHKPFFEYAGLDLQYIQKIFLIFSIYILFEKYNIQSKTLDIISNTSFAIFFIHPWLIFILFKVYGFLGINITAGNNNILLYVFSITCVLLLSVFLSLVIKKVFKGSKNTRYVMGY
ncbi:acyltransferase family protein [Vibrio natriegens]|uniref:acyltransferase family protein n=1 Tax=Vibrio natriegens TaxID=691 RepID=UPI001594A7C2|nr:acyltransferase [Vibrio natriegens]